MLKLALVLSSALLVAGCATSNAPVTVEAECRLFPDPGFAVKGAAPRDDRWITKVQETGIRVCEWKRP